VNHIPPPLYELGSSGTIRFDLFTNDAFELPLAWLVTELVEGDRKARHKRWRNRIITLYGVVPSRSYGRGIRSRHLVYAGHKNGVGWMDWAELVDLSTVSDVELVPAIGVMDRKSAVDFCLAGFESKLGAKVAAGVVARTSPDVYDRRSNLLWWSLRSDWPTGLERSRPGYKVENYEG
jgi:hypothetical protein